MSTGPETLAATSDGVFTRVDALGAGHTDRDLRAWVRQGAVRRLRRGIFATGPAPAFGSERMVERARGLARLHGDDIAISHHAALALHGIALFDVPFDVVHAVRLSGAAQSAPGFRLIRPAAPPPTTSVQGVCAVTPAVAVVQVASACGLRAGVVAADSAMHRGGADLTSLATEPERVGRIEGLQTARVAVARSRPGAESAGESILRLIAEDLGYVVQVQFAVADAESVFARTDLRLEGTRSLWEFDGGIKYAGANGRQALMSEKVREDRIRRLGWGLDRVVWRDFDRVDALRLRIRAAAEQHRIR